MDWDPIIDGLRVSGIGMGMVGVVLVILAMVVRLTAWADARVSRPGAVETTTIEEETAAEASRSRPPDDGESMRAALIGVALALAERMEARTPGPISAEGSPAAPTGGSWLTEGRARQRSRRESARNVGVWR